MIIIIGNNCSLHFVKVSLTFGELSENIRILEGEIYFLTFHMPRAEVGIRKRRPSGTCIATVCVIIAAPCLGVIFCVPSL